MHADRTGKLLHTAAVAALLLVSCDRRPQPNQDGAQSKPTSVVGTAGASEPAVPPPLPTGQDASGAPASNARVQRDPEAIKALENMATYLRGLKAFQIRSETSRDEVLDDGQTVAFAGVVDMIVERPNRLRADVTSDKQQRFYFADGTNFSVWARRVNYYATVPAPPTLRELADQLTDKYDLELPLADLFYWGERKSTDEITSALDVGPSQVDGTTCEHYAFRQQGADWQVWIQQGPYPLPRKLIITTTTDPSRPQFASTMTWNLAPSYNDAAFKFVPPKDAKRITLSERLANPSH